MHGKLLDQQKLLDGVDLLKIKAVLLLGEQYYKEALPHVQSAHRVRARTRRSLAQPAACQKNMPNGGTLKSH